MGHTHLSFVVEITSNSKSFNMYKLFVLAAVLATATAEGFYPAGYAGIHGGLYGHGYAGLAGYGAYGYGLGHLGYAAPVAAAAPVANRYAVPAPRVLEEAPIVEKIVEPVEQW